MTRTRIAIAREALVAKMNRRRDGVAQHRKLQHRDVEAASIEAHQGACEAFGARPEFAHEFFPRVIAEREALDRAQHVVIVNISNRDRNREMKRDGEKVAVAAASQIFAIALESLAVAESLTVEVDLVEQVFVDSGLDVEDRESHQPGRSSSPSMIFAATDLKAAV